MRWKRSEHGFITVPAAIMLAVVCLFELVLVDASSVISGQLFYRRRAVQALRSVMAAYDSILFSKYGILGMDISHYPDMETDFIKYISEPLETGVIQTGRFKRGERELSVADPLSEPKALKQAIVSDMKYRSVANGALFLADYLGLINDAAQGGKGMSYLAKGNNALNQAEQKLEELKIKVEGYFSGDMMCVNGFSNRYSMFLLTTGRLLLKLRSLSDIEAAPELALEALEELDTQLTVYRKLNTDAFDIVAELKQLADEINRYANLAENELNSISDESTKNELKRGVTKLRTAAVRMSNDGLTEDLLANIKELNERSGCVKQDILYMDAIITGGYDSITGPVIYTADGDGERTDGEDAGEPLTLSKFIENITKALRSEGINCDLSVSRYYLNADESLNEYDSRKKVTADLSIYPSDAYSVPDAVYATLPSVVQTMTVNAADMPSDFSSADSLSSFLNSISGDNSASGVLTSIAQKYLICDYVNSYFRDVTDAVNAASTEKAEFICEKEYIIGGHKDSKSNIKAAVNRIMGIRFLFNFLHCVTNEEKHSFASEVGQAIATATYGIGGEIYALLLMCAWACAETYLDIKALERGEKVVLVKTADTWKSSIDGLLKGAASEAGIDISEDGGSGGDAGESGSLGSPGFTYSQYLVLIMLLMPEETLLYRIADVIEINMTDYIGERYKLSGVVTTIKCKLSYYPVLLTPFAGVFGKERLRVEICESFTY